MKSVGIPMRPITPGTMAAFVALLSIDPGAQAQDKGGGANAAASQATTAASSQTGSTSPSGGSGLQGISFARDSWEAKLKAPTADTLGIKSKDAAKNVVILCYKLVAGNSASQPFILETDRAPAAWKPNAPYRDGALVAASTTNGHYYQAHIFARSNDKPPAWPVDGTSIADTSALSWKDLGLISESPALPTWMPGAPFQAGVQIRPNPSNGHYYQAEEILPARSNNTPPAWPVNGTVVAENASLSWKDLGSISPGAGGHCDDVSPSKPLLMNQFLVVRIDMTDIP